jgi:putative phage-type endonuclease
MDNFDLELIQASEQRSEVWRDARCGKFTASEIWKLMTNPRSKSAEWSETALTYINTKVAEELTGQVHQNSNAFPLVWGEENEPNAKAYFENITKLKVEQCGFQPFTDHSGGSPDGLIGEDSIIEIKCPYNSANQIDYLQIESDLDIYEGWPEYYWQMQANMLFTKRVQCYFITYDPRFNNDSQRIKVVLVLRNPEHQTAMLERLEKAIEKKLSILNKLKNG